MKHIIFLIFPLIFTSLIFAQDSGYKIQPNEYNKSVVANKKTATDSRTRIIYFHWLVGLGYELYLGDIEDYIPSAFSLQTDLGASCVYKELNLSIGIERGFSGLKKLDISNEANMEAFFNELALVNYYCRVGFGLLPSEEDDTFFYAFIESEKAAQFSLLPENNIGNIEGIVSSIGLDYKVSTSEGGTFGIRLKFGQGSYNNGKAGNKVLLCAYTDLFSELYKFHK
jgi:hypothetical protein